MRSKKKIIIITSCTIIIIAFVIAMIILQSQGTFSKGNDEKYSVKNTQVLENSPIENKTIIFLGSSVTYGATSKGESFVDYLEKEDGITAVKEAVSGTTLVDNGDSSYVSRMKAIDKSIEADAFICQLSTNDATKRKPLGEISDSTDINTFDTSTIIGAMEYITAYAKDTWNCPVIFYTGTKYSSDYYGEMVNALLKLQEKWDIGVIDLWNSEEMNAVSSEDYKLYMVNGIHPSRAGYKLWWTPQIQKYLYENL